jgi:hypothetical protein
MGTPGTAEDLSLSDSERATTAPGLPSPSDRKSRPRRRTPVTALVVTDAPLRRRYTSLPAAGQRRVLREYDSLRSFTAWSKSAIACSGRRTRTAARGHVVAPGARALLRAGLDPSRSQINRKDVRLIDETGVCEVPRVSEEWVSCAARLVKNLGQKLTRNRAIG